MENLNNSKIAPEAGFSFIQAVNGLVSGFSERSRDIIALRYGLDGGKPATLEQIGKKYRITRERVRQIIQEVLKKIKEAKEQGVLGAANREIMFTVGENSGIIKKENLISMAGRGSNKEEAAVRLFLECFSNPASREIKGELKNSYSTEKFNLSFWKKLKDGVKNILEAKKDPLTDDELFEKISQKNYPEITRKQLFDYLAISEEIKRNNFGKWGLAGWEEITPKGTREKAFLVLKETNKPLHFRKIAELIDYYKLNKKKTHPQTVHNELIKDSRFVLVGRGVYALAEWGYQRGTVKEILEDILKKNATPMKREDILSAILKMRQVKKSTVMINLNHFFARNSRDEYSIKK